ncbi:MAG: Uncharacterised protein [Cryomorphaceae bacterium]|nr:MAG: Uncharacterised protein [Cryomorphaceae bacterium]
MFNSGIRAVYFSLVRELFIASLKPVLESKSEIIFLTCSGFTPSLWEIVVFNFEGIAIVLNP